MGEYEQLPADGMETLQETVKMLGRRWSLPILTEIHQSPRENAGFRELQNRLDHISSKVLSERLKVTPAQLYKEITGSLTNHYPWLYIAFEEVIEKNVSLEKLGLKKEISEKLEEIIREKIKPKKVEIVSKISIQTYDENGLELIKQAFAKIKEIDSHLMFNYLGGGTYRMLITAKDYKKAESLLKDVQDKMTSLFGGKKGVITFERQGA